MIKVAKGIWNKLKNTKKSSTDNKNSLLRTEIENTPFHVTGSDDQGYILSIGMYRLTEPAKTAEEALNKLNTEPWNIVSRIVATYLDYDKKAALYDVKTVTENT